MDSNFRLHLEQMRMESHGQTFHSQVEKTFVNGHLVYHNHQVDKAHRGKELRFKR